MITTRRRQQVFAVISALALAACQGTPPTGPAPGAPPTSLPQPEANGAAPAVVPAVPAVPGSPANSALVLPGRVVVAGQPLADANLVLFDAVTNAPMALSAPVTTDAEGNFSLPVASLEEGTVIRVVATTPDGRTLTTLLSRLTPETTAAYQVQAIGDGSVFSFEEETSSATNRLVLSEATTLLSHMASGLVSLSAAIRTSRGPAARAQARVLRGVLGQLNATRRYLASSQGFGDRLLRDTSKTGLPGTQGTASMGATNIGASAALTGLVQLTLQALAQTLRASPSAGTFDVAPLPLIGTRLQANLQAGVLTINGARGGAIVFGGGASPDAALAAIGRPGAFSSSDGSSGGSSTGGSTVTTPTIASNTMFRYAGAGVARLDNPTGLAIDASGNRYIADATTHAVQKVTPSGEISIVAGTGIAGFSGDNGPASAAQLSSPQAIAVDAVGNLYIADSANYRIRKVTASTGIITTIAGNGASGIIGDNGPATEAPVSPNGVAVDGDGNLYIAETNYYRVRKVTASTGVITTIAGTGASGSSGDDGPATSATFGILVDVAVDGDGHVYIADAGNNRIRKVTASTGIITTIAGTGTAGYSGDDGPATSAALNSPFGVAVDGEDNLYIADRSNNRIRKVTASTGTITTVAGNGQNTVNLADTVATSAAIARPTRVAVDTGGTVVVAQPNVDLVRQFTAAGALSVVAGVDAVSKGDNGPATRAVLGHDYGGLAIDSSGNLLIADYSTYRIRKVTASTGVITNLAGTGTSGYSGDNGQATDANISGSYGVAVDGSGNVYFADDLRVRKVNAAGIITTVAGTGINGVSGDGGPATDAQVGYAIGVAVDGSGNLYIFDGSARIRKVDAASGIITTVVGTGIGGFSGDGGLATDARVSNYITHGVFDGSGNLYFADAGNHVIRKVTASTGIITTIAGTGGISGFSGDGGSATAAQLSDPSGVVLDGSGNVYIADSNNNRIRKVTVATGVITTIAGNGTIPDNGYPTGEGGSLLNAQLSYPYGLAIDANRVLYVFDQGARRVVRFKE